MNNIFLNSEDYDTAICNSLGCSNKGTIRIVLPVGSKSLTIVVCENCRIKFE